MKKILFIIFFLIQIIHAQTKSITLNTDDNQIKMIFNTIVQGIKQNRMELFLPYLSNQFRDYDDNIMTKIEQKNRIETFFLNMEKRKKLKNWESLAPSKDLLSNWDFETDIPIILVSGDVATVSFNYSWISNIPLMSNTTINELAQPSLRTAELWYFNKVNNQWTLSKSHDLFRIMKLVSIAR
jgi:hypothetical protein